MGRLKFLDPVSPSDWARRLSNPLIAQVMIGGWRYYSFIRQLGGTASPRTKRVEKEFKEQPFVSPYAQFYNLHGNLPNTKVSIMLADPLYYGENDSPFEPIRPYVTFDFIPEKVEVATTGKVSSLGIVGINFAKYHWGGGDSTVKLNIDWYDFMGRKDRLIDKCRKVEALTRADGYRKGPPTINIIWGGGPLLEGEEYIVVSANYDMDTFLNMRTRPDPSNHHITDVYPNGLQPLHANQELVLKRVAPQLTHKQLITR